MKNKKIKTIFCLVLILCCCLSFASCGDKKEQITSVNDLSGKDIVVALGSSNALDIADWSENIGANPLLAPTSADAFSMLAHGKVYAYAVDNIMAKTLMKQASGFTVLPESIPDLGYGIAVQKGSRLKDQINACLTDFKERGVLDTLEEKWINKDSNDAKPISQIWAGRSGTITCRVASNYAPFAFYNTEDELAGYDIDLVLMIAKQLDYRVEFSEGEVADVLVSLSAGQIDMVAGGITITEERLKNVDFSDSYYESSTVFMVQDLSVEIDRGTFFDRVHKIFFEEGRDKLIVNAMLMSTKMIFICFFAGLALGAVLFLIRYSGIKVFGFIFDKIKSLIGLSPVVGWLFVVYYIFFAGNSSASLIAGLVAFSTIFGLGVYGSFVSSVGAIDNGQVEAATSMGYSRYKALFKVFLPQSMPGFLRGISGEVIGLVKITSLIEFLGIQDVQTVTDAFRAAVFEAIIPIAFCCIFYIVFAFLFSKFLAYLADVVDRHNRSEEVIKKNVLRGKI